MAKNTGKDYEKFVQSLYQAILTSENMGFGSQKNIIVETNKKLVGNNNIEREFDIYWEYELAGIIYKTVIECKDYNKKVSLEKIDALDSKIRDFPNLRGIFATKKGYQTGAEIKAKEKQIELLIVREQNDTDWTLNGEPLLKEIHIQMNAILPARILEFNIKLPLGASIPPTTQVNKDIQIIDSLNNDSYTVYDLQMKLMQGHKEEEGIFEKELNFKGKVIAPTIEIDIEGFYVKYQIFKIAKSSIVIDFSEKLLGVIEYLNQGKKVKVYKDFVNVLNEN